MLKISINVQKVKVRSRPSPRAGRPPAGKRRLFVLLNATPLIHLRRRSSGKSSSAAASGSVYAPPGKKVMLEGVVTSPNYGLDACAQMNIFCECRAGYFCGNTRHARTRWTSLHLDCGYRDQRQVAGRDHVSGVIYHSHCIFSDGLSVSAIFQLRCLQETPSVRHEPSRHR